ncbi:hypothetical protein RJ639_004586 [Escallonia herrerae]|uniref:DUF4283 domain-containing protein n=1 Tax=Escallonia herrerae TaxID=1293975 RepID=A0AA88W1G9_9ASTE|nr:hypothetical protein RJ639_004586 [Escallonia herrerae]
MDLGTVASMSESRLVNPQNSAILDCSSGVAELWRRGKVSLGFSASTDMDRTCCEPIPNPTLPIEAPDLLLLTYGDSDETYLDGEYNTGDDEDIPLGLCCLDSETRRLKIARLATRRARSILYDFDPQKLLIEQMDWNVAKLVLWEHMSSPAAALLFASGEPPPHSSLPTGEPPPHSHHLGPQQNFTSTFPIQKLYLPTDSALSQASSSAEKATTTHQYVGPYQHLTTPPNRDHHAATTTISFKDTLINQTGDETMDMILGDDDPSDDDEPVSALSPTIKCHTPFIHLTTHTKTRIRQPWKKTLIVKTIGAFFSATAIAPRLNEIWCPTEKSDVIQLANGFHIIKFQHEIDYHKALEQGPWFIGTHFLSVQRWSHNFDPNNQKIGL